MPHHRLATLLIAVVPLAWTAPGAAQTAPAGERADSSAAQRPERRIERIRIEDAGSRIDELRVGGETQTIAVSPKGGMPTYDVIPGSANRNLAHGERGSGAVGGGTRVWKVLGF